MKIFKSLGALLLIWAGLSPAFLLNAQSKESVYSRYGYGSLRDHTTSAQRAMGGVGYAMQSGRQVNVMNPASYAAIDSMTFLFDMGLTLTYLDAKDGDNRASDFGGGLDYITMQFPIGKIMGASIGLLPYTSTGYSFGEGIDNGANTFEGEGGINILYAGFAIRPLVPGLSVGLNAGYMFGTTRYDNYVYTTTGSTALFERVMEVRDYYLQLGVQYGVNLNRDHRIQAGFTYSPEKSLHGRTYGLMYDQTSESAPEPENEMRLGGNYSVAASYGAGLAYRFKENLSVEVDYTYQPWKNVKYTALPGYEGAVFDDRYKIAVGAEYMINPRGNWAQRIRFRAGAYYDRDYVMVVNDAGRNHVRKQGVTFGFGLPAPSSKTLINLGFEFYNRQATPNPLVKENFFAVTLGVNFNELWFWKNKIL